MLKGYILSFLLIGSMISSDAAGNWSYPDLEDEEEFPSWGGICDNGKEQSPIALSEKTSLKGIYKDLEYEHYKDELQGAHIVNNGHTITIRKFTNKLEVKGGALKGDYVLDQIHFHWFSEHTIDDFRYPLEMHLVHRSENYTNITQAALHEDGIVVLAVLYHESNTGNPAITKIFQNDMLKNIDDDNDINLSYPLSAKFSVRELMPEELDDTYFTYEGSLTTPPCSETVIWIVYKDTEPVSQEQLEMFQEIEDGEGDKIKNNYRLIQKRFNRRVVYVIDEEGNLDDEEGINDENDDTDDEPKEHKCKEDNDKDDDDDDVKEKQNKDNEDKDGDGKPDKAEVKTDTKDDDGANTISLSFAAITVMIASRILNDF